MTDYGVDIIPIWWDRQEDVPSLGAEDRYNYYGGNDNAYAVFGGEVHLSDYMCNPFLYLESYEYFQNHTSPLVIDLQFLQEETSTFQIETEVILDDNLLTENCKIFFVVTCDTLEVYLDGGIPSAWNYKVLAASDYYDFGLNEAGQSATFSQTFQIEPFDFISIEDYKAIVIVQDLYDGKIIQAERVALGTYLEVKDEVITIPNAFTNYPNPFNPTTTISFTSKNAKGSKVDIYNLRGQKIKSILIPSSPHSPITSITWNGDDDFGKPVSSGIYYYKLNINGKTEAVKKCLLLK